MKITYLYEDLDYKSEVNYETLEDLARDKPCFKGLLAIFAKEEVDKCKIELTLNYPAVVSITVEK